jgi:cephalosporin-C deacetylase
MVREPEDFDGFWQEVVGEVSGFTPRPVVTRWENEDPAFDDEYIIDGSVPGGDAAGSVPGGGEQPPNPFDFRWEAHTLITGMTVRKVTFEAQDGHKVGGLLQYPNHTGRRAFPAIVHFTGYGGELLLDQDLVTHGYAVFNFSHRGMYLGSEGFDRHLPVPLLVRGIERPGSYVYRDIAADCLTALKVVRALDQVDPGRVGVMGTSQGGALSVMIAALDHGVLAAAADLPWLTNFEYQLSHRMQGPTEELAEYLRRYPENRDKVCSTLGYFDALFFGSRLRSPAFVSLGQEDTTCPPETVRELFRRIPAVKMLLELPGTGHERSTLWRSLARNWFDFYL